MKHTDEQADIQETMEGQVGALRDALKGQVIVGVARERGVVTITLNGGKRVRLRDTDDCCAYGAVDDVNVNLAGAVVTDVITDDEFERWFILGESKLIAELDVSWDVVNYPYCVYGLEIQVESD